MSVLRGIRVIELASERCAFAGKLMGDMGADVIVIEPPEGAPQRGHEPFAEDKPDIERSLSWWHHNTSKRSVVLNWRGDEGRQALLKLIAGADVLIEAEGPGALAAAGIDDADLTRVNARLIHVAITPFGPEGERSMDEASDLTLIASGGIAAICGYDDNTLPPIRPMGQHGFVIGEHYAFMSVLTALIEREGSGKGQRIDVSLNAAVNVTTELSSYNWLVSQTPVIRQTGRHCSPVPSMRTQYRCADGKYVTTGMPPRTARQFQTLLDWFVGLGFDKDFPETVFLEMGTKIPRLSLAQLGTDDEATAIFGAAREALAFAAQRMSAYDFFVSVQRTGIAVGIVYSPDEAFEDEHFKARGMQVEVEQPQIGRAVRHVGAPYAFEKTPWSISRPAPGLGEHTREVLSEAGIDTETTPEARLPGRYDRP